MTELVFRTAPSLTFDNAKELRYYVEYVNDKGLQLERGKLYFKFYTGEIQSHHKKLWCGYIGI